MDLEKYYLGTDYKGNITLEQARNIKIAAKFRCKRGHVFISTVDRAEYDIENEMCHCCRLHIGDAEEMGTRANDDTYPTSLFQLDYEIFGGLIDKMISPETDCYINHESYRSRRGMGFVINAKYKKISPYQMVKKMTEEHQVLLAEKYRNQDKLRQFFLIVKCEACGKYMIRYREHIDLENMKCDFCKEFVHQPFSFGRWLKEHFSERLILEDVYSEEEFKRICSLHKDDSLTPILVSNKIGARSVTPLEITHGIVNIKYL
ncbi:MAG: hypothetical protein IKY94_05560 [Lachnospiraceae bacterium]|nr:hypothetical protein [Lachnospiraceae bacterium]